MCIGVPMQVVKMQDTHAICEADGKQELIDMILVGEQVAGTWILNFLGAARDVLTEENAQNIRQALTAMSDIMQGEKHIDHLFADLIDREPELPPHLQAQVLSQTPTKES
ncbi:MAG: HypC/HybG/HupF family hydrogenase formation chaperone [Gammaproteobacteria bacterium]|nr:MAG: HypC/HybG/HupF family hydrogenase formation chaperone [Gammaproteobacteria bacterium]